MNNPNKSGQSGQKPGQKGMAPPFRDTQQGQSAGNSSQHGGGSGGRSTPPREASVHADNTQRPDVHRDRKPGGR